MGLGTIITMSTILLSFKCRNRRFLFWFAKTISRTKKQIITATKIVRLHWSTLFIIETTSLRVQRYHTYKYPTFILGYHSGQTVTNALSSSMVSNGEPSCNSILQAKIQGSRLSLPCASLHSRISFFTLCRGRDEIARKPGRAGCSYSYRVVVFMNKGVSF